MKPISRNPISAHIKPKTTALGQLLAETRVGKGLTMRKVEERSGVGLGIISNLETGVATSTSVETFIALAKGVGLKPTTLLSRYLKKLETFKPKQGIVLQDKTFLYPPKTL